MFMHEFAAFLVSQLCLLWVLYLMRLIIGVETEKIKRYRGLSYLWSFKMNSHIFVFKEKYVKYSLNKILGGSKKGFYFGRILCKNVFKVSARIKQSSKIVFLTTRVCCCTCSALPLNAVKVSRPCNKSNLHKQTPDHIIAVLMQMTHVYNIK